MKPYILGTPYSSMLQTQKNA